MPFHQQLYDATVFSSGGMTKVLKKLEDREYITRCPSQEDKRSLLVCITPLGMKIVEDALEQIVISKEKIFNILTNKEQESLNKILEKLTRSLYKG